VLRRWAAEQREGTVSTADFVALAERVSGQSLSGLFDDWLYVARRPADY
jgi:aminopeptidase N